MGQIATTIRMDAKLKAEFDKLCEEFGMSANTAFNIYVKTVIRQRRIPFTIEADPIDDVMERGRKAFYEMRKIAAENGTAGMSLDEINEEIRLARRGEELKHFPKKPFVVTPAEMLQIIQEMNSPNHGLLSEPSARYGKK